MDSTIMDQLRADIDKRVRQVDKKCPRCGEYLFQYLGENQAQWDLSVGCIVRVNQYDMLPCVNCESLIQDLITGWGKACYMSARASRAQRNGEPDGAYQADTGRYTEWAKRQRDIVAEGARMMGMELKDIINRHEVQAKARMKQ